jgi:hypothetical protein
VNIVLYSQMPEGLVQKILLHAAPNFLAGVDEAVQLAGEQTRIAVLPYAVSTIPSILPPDRP